MCANAGPEQRVTRADTEGTKIPRVRYSAPESTDIDKIIKIPEHYPISAKLYSDIPKIRKYRFRHRNMTFVITKLFDT
jgi:hypothetical protein